MTFQADILTDRDGVFLDVSGEGYAEAAISYRVAATGVTSLISAVVEEQVFAILDTRANNKFFISVADITLPERGDQLTQGIEEWTVLDVQTNMVFVEFEKQLMQSLIEYLFDRQIIFANNSGKVRLVIHKDISRNDIDTTVGLITQFID